MILNSTSSRTRVELTVSPTSLRACSCSTLRASSTLPSLQGPHQVDVAYHRCGLGGEGLEHRCRPVVERFHLGPPQADRAHDLVVEDERGGDQRAVAGDLLHVPPAVARVGEDVGDLLDPSVQGDPSGHRLAITTDGVRGHIALELRRQARLSTASSNSSPCKR